MNEIFEKNLRPYFNNSSIIRKNNIESNWKIIAGGLQNHKNGEHINRYGITHIIRQIDDYSFFRVTKNLFNLCKKNNIDIPTVNVNKKKEYRLNKSERQKINRLLKKCPDVNDYIIIEHLNGGVRGVVKKLISSEIKDWKSLQKIHLENNLCCCKLNSADKDLDHNTELNNIELK